VIESQIVSIPFDGSFDIPQFGKGYVLSHLEADTENEVYHCTLEKRDIVADSETGILKAND
jgi:hypothetical protein